MLLRLQENFEKGKLDEVYSRISEALDSADADISVRVLSLRLCCVFTKYMGLVNFAWIVCFVAISSLVRSSYTNGNSANYLIVSLIACGELGVTSSKFSPSF